MNFMLNSGNCQLFCTQLALNEDDSVPVVQVVNCLYNLLFPKKFTWNSKFLVSCLIAMTKKTNK